ncbi:MAG TPA: hypothetical protein VFZ73_05880 [Gemmatimonadaceae bacterium]
MSVEIAAAQRGLRPRSVSSDRERYFHTVAAITMLLLTLVGFMPFYLKGTGMAGREISPQLFPLVLAHGSLMTSWVLLFLAQALLISTRHRRLHMKLGWLAVAVAIGVTVTGFMVAVESVRTVPDFPFWGMAYRQFLLIMLAEVALFTAFVLAGVLSRKRPNRHRAMMLLATLSILAGATVRMPILFPVFGETGWVGVFGPIFTLGGAFLVVRWFLTKSFDHAFAAGYAAMVVMYVGASCVALSDAWSRLARTMFDL